MRRATLFCDGSPDALHRREQSASAPAVRAPDDESRSG
jgi:hypothetical protein